MSKIIENKYANQKVKQREIQSESMWVHEICTDLDFADVFTEWQIGFKMHMIARQQDRIHSDFCLFCLFSTTVTFNANYGVAFMILFWQSYVISTVKTERDTIKCLKI